MKCPEKIKSKKVIFIIVSICFVILGTAGGLATFFLMKNKNKNRTEILNEKNDKKATKQTSLKEDMKELENRYLSACSGQKQHQYQVNRIANRNENVAISLAKSIVQLITQINLNLLIFVSFISYES